jgi:hypothetical protein
MSEPKSSAPVEVTNSDPMPVSIIDHQDHDSPAQSDARAVAATRRSVADISRVDDQQRISGIWESTQRIIALAVVLDALFVVSMLVLTPTLLAALGHPADDAAKTAAVGGLLFLTAVSNLVIGFYFGRTNHQRVGGDASSHDDARGR